MQRSIVALIVFIESLFWQPVLGEPFDAPNAVGFSEGRGAVQVEGKWGFIDAIGQVVVQPMFEAVRPYSEGLAAARQDEQWGFIDASGHWVIDPQYENVHKPFRNGLVAVMVQPDQWGLIDRTGQFVMPPTQAEPPMPSEGLVGIQADTDRWGFKDMAGHWVIPPTYGAVYPFNLGLAAARQNGQWGFVDRTGKFVIGPKYAKVQGFSEGLAVVVERVEAGGRRDGAFKWIYIDRQGRQAIPQIFHDATSFSEGFAAVQDMDGRWQLIDSSGQRKGEYYQWSRSPCEGYAVVEIGVGYWSLYSVRHQEVLPLHLAWCGDVNEGIAVARDESDRYGYVGLDGEWIWEPSGEAVTLFPKN